MTQDADGYRLLARLRGLERQLRRVRGEWRSFRDEPTAERLSDTLRQARRLEQALRDMEGHMRGSGGPSHIASSGAGALPGRDRPAPRDVVSASRDLDARVSEAGRRWRSVLDGDTADDLDRLVSVLRGSVDRSATLLVALGGTLSPAPENDPDASPATPEVSITGLASEFEGMLWKLRADWQQARRAPNPDRLRVLLDSFQAAAGLASTLQKLHERTGDETFRKALRVGRQLTDGVHFLPYRDPFTGAYNREGFEALAGAELKRCRRYGRPFGLLCLEIAPPHLAGLQRAVATARAELREYDLVARYVEDLILIGVPEGGAGPTRRVASRVLKALRAGEMGGWFRQLSYATLPEDGATLGGLIDTARERLQA